MKRYIRSTTVESPSEYLINNYPIYDKGMQTYDIDGKSITTNFRASNKPYWNGYSKARGYSDYRNVEWGKQDQIFDELVNAGYTDLKFAVMPTSIRGLTRQIVWYK